MKSECSATVYDPTGWGHNHRCSRNGKIEEDSKWWCKQHAPSSVKTRIEASRASWQADQDRRMAPYDEADRLRAVNAKLIQCLERIAGALNVPAASQLANVKELARMAIEEAEHGR